MNENNTVPGSTPTLSGSYSLCEISTIAKNSLNDLSEFITKASNSFNFLETDTIWQCEVKEQYKETFIQLKNRIINIENKINSLGSALNNIATELTNADTASTDQLGTKVIENSILKKFFINTGISGNRGGIFNSPFGDEYAIRINSDFGARDKYDNNRNFSNHEGIDLVPVNSMGQIVYGVDIKSMTDGKVLESAFNNAMGNYVSVEVTQENGEKIIVYYIHLGSRNVKVGDVVTTDTKIGIMGNTGNSNGAHLDIKIMDSNGSKIDPLPFIANVKRDTDHYDNGLLSVTRLNPGTIINTDGSIVYNDNLAVSESGQVIQEYNHKPI